jgi:hypothetical protein
MQIGLYAMSRMVFVISVLTALPLVTGCASSGGSLEGSTGLSLIGDERGGTIPNSVGTAAQSSAFQMVTAHCAKFGKKGFITKMDFESGLMTFQCIVQKPKGT